MRVRVNGGYQPAVVHARVGEPLCLIFSREETAACSEHVVFPGFGKSVMLPPFEDVPIDLNPERAGEFPFTCQFGMLDGRLVVDGERSEAKRRSVRVVALTWLRGRGPNGETVLLAFLGWLCSLPILLLLAAPLLGWRAGVALAVLWFGVGAAACFALCARRFRRSGAAGRTRAARPAG